MKFACFWLEMSFNIEVCIFYKFEIINKVETNWYGAGWYPNYKIVEVPYNNKFIFSFK